MTYWPDCFLSSHLNLQRRAHATHCPKVVCSRHQCLGVETGEGWERDAVAERDERSDRVEPPEARREGERGEPGAHADEAHRYERRLAHALHEPAQQHGLGQEEHHADPHEEEPHVEGPHPEALGRKEGDERLEHGEGAEDVEEEVEEEGDAAVVHLWVRARLLLGSANDHFDARLELERIDRLDDVIVGAFTQTMNFVLNLILAR